MVIGYYLLPLTDVLHQDLIQRLVEKEDFVSTSIKFLDENALLEVVEFSAHLSEVEDLYI